MTRLLITLLLAASVQLTAQMGRYPFSSTGNVTEEPGGVVDCSFWYAFNGDLTDEMGGSDATALGNVYYEGDSCLIFSDSDGNDRLSVGNIQTLLGGAKDHSRSYRIYIDDGITNVNHYAHASSSGGTNNGYYVYFDPTGEGTLNWDAWVANGVSNDNATTTGGAYSSQMLDDTWYDIVEVWDYDGNGTNVYVQFWVDGVQWNEGDTIIAGQSPIDLNLTGYMGGNSGASFGLRDGDKLDEYRLYPIKLSSTQIAELNSDPYNLPNE